MNKDKLFILVLVLLISVGRVAAQPNAVYDKMKYEFGSLLWYSPGLVTFTVTNAGNKTLQIKDVRPSCGCTHIEWTKTEIQPGESGQIRAVYDAEMLGHFEKTIGVLTNESDKPVYLTITGDIVRELKTEDYNGEYPFVVGDIHLSTDNLEFDDVKKGDSPQQIINIINTGKSTYVPELMHLPKYLKMQAIPERLRGGRSGKIVVTLDSKNLKDMGLNQTSIYVSRFPGDKVSPANEISVSSILLPSFQSLSEQQLKQAPALSLSSNDLDLGGLEGKSKVKGTILLTNKGSKDLSIRSLQVFNPAINVSLGKQTIPVGGSTKLKITVIGKYLKKSKSRLRVLMITNDPKNPKAIIEIKVKP